jgi:hypothetical protein
VPTIDPGGTRDGAPAAPEMPSFESLRDRRRSSAVDLLVPGAPPAEPAPAAPVSAPVLSERPAAPAAGGPRPAEYGDLVRLGGHLLSAAVALPLRLAARSVRGPARWVRRLLDR